MFEETYGTTGFRTSTESAAFWQVTLLAVLSAWLAAGTVSWAAGYLITLGVLGPLIFLLHRVKGRFRSSRNGRRYLLFLLPVLFMIAVFFTGLRTQPVYSIEADGGLLLLLRESTGIAPVNADPLNGWAPALLAITIYLSALNVLLVLESRWALSRILHAVLISGAFVAVLGYLQMLFSAEKIFGIFTPPGLSFFASFPHGDLWSGYALLLTGLGLALTHQDKYRQNWSYFLRSKDAYPLYLTCLIGSTLFFQPTPGVLPTLLVLIGLFFLFETAPYLQRSSSRKYTGAIFGNVLIAVVLLAGAIYLGVLDLRPVSAIQEEKTSFTTITQDDPYSLQRPLLRDSWNTFQQRPLFGWGEGSFPQIFAFYQEVDLQGGFYTHPRSDLMRSLVERGVIGTAIWGLPLLLALLYVRKKHRLRSFSWFLLTLTLCGAILGIFSYPFASPAFALLWWLIFFSGLRWSSLDTHTLSSEVIRSAPRAPSIRSKPLPPPPPPPPSS